MNDRNSAHTHLGNGFTSLVTVWRDELKAVSKDAGVLIFFFIVPLLYPVLYAFIYNNEVVREAKLVVVDQSDSYLSREFTRRVDATPDVQVVGVVNDMVEAKRMLDEKQAYGILSFPAEFSKEVYAGRQTQVSLYSDMSALLFYKSFLIAATDVSLEMGSEVRMRNHPASTDKLAEITSNPIPYESVSYYNTPNGFASFLVPAILILVLQQTLLFGIGMRFGTEWERHPNRLLRQPPMIRLLGKSLAYLILYIPVCLWVLVIVPRLFGLPQVGDPVAIGLFLLPYLLACIFLGLLLGNFMPSREAPMMLLVFSSVILIFISGISWPWVAVPPFWKAVGFLFPSTPGIQGFVRLNTMAAPFHEVADSYLTMWAQTLLYLALAYVAQRWRNRKVINSL